MPGVYSDRHKLNINGCVGLYQNEDIMYVNLNFQFVKHKNKQNS